MRIVNRPIFKFGVFVSGFVAVALFQNYGKTRSNGTGSGEDGSNTSASVSTTNPDETNNTSGTGSRSPSTGGPGNQGGGPSTINPGNQGGGSTNLTSGSSSLMARATPSTVVKGSTATLTVTATNIGSVTYACSSTTDSTVSITGTIDLTQPSVRVPVNADLVCSIVGKAVPGSGLSDQATTVSIAMSCGNQVKVNGACVDFNCQSVVQLTSASQLSNVPARTGDGICYSYALAGQIPNGPSNLTTAIDGQVLSANHDGPGDHHPYLLKGVMLNFLIAGPRVVKLAGALDAVSPILVDNFLLYGIFPVGANLTDVTQWYHVAGTTDSSTHDDQGVQTGAISFRQQLLPIISFGANGTSSIAPINLSTSVAVGVTNTLNLRAEDCGGSRELSNIYLLFQ